MLRIDSKTCFFFFWIASLTIDPRKPLSAASFLFSVELDATFTCCALSSAVTLTLQRHGVFLLLYQQVIGMLVWPAGDSASKPNTSICCPLLRLQHSLLSCYVLCSQHSEVYSFHSMWEFHFVFSFGGVRQSGKCTVFTVIYLHFGMCTSHGITLRVFNSCQKLLNVIQWKQLNKRTLEFFSV